MMHGHPRDQPLDIERGLADTAARFAGFRAPGLREDDLINLLGSDAVFTDTGKQLFFTVEIEMRQAWRHMPGFQLTLGLTEGFTHQCFTQLAEFLLLFHTGKPANG